MTGEYVKSNNAVQKILKFPKRTGGISSNLHILHLQSDPSRSLLLYSGRPDDEHPVLGEGRRHGVRVDPRGHHVPI